MTISFPRDLPACGVASIAFELVRYETVNQLYGGQTQGREAATPRWRATISLLPMRRAEFQAWTAWRNSLKGALNGFLVHDLGHPFPINYRRGFAGMSKAGGGAFDGTANVTALTATTIAMGGLPAGFALKAGDYVGLVQSGKRALHQLVEDATANGSGAVTVTVEPPVLTSIFTSAAGAHFAKPACEMRMETGSWDATRTPRAGSPISFSAIQKVL